MFSCLKYIPVFSFCFTPSLCLWEELKRFCSSLGCMFFCVTIPCSPPLPSGFDVRGGPELSCHRPSLPPAPQQSAWWGAGVRGASPRARCQAGLLQGQFGLCVVGTLRHLYLYLLCLCADWRHSCGSRNWNCTCELAGFSRCMCVCAVVTTVCAMPGSRTGAWLTLLFPWCICVC